MGIRYYFFGSSLIFEILAFVSCSSSSNGPVITPPMISMVDPMQGRPGEFVTITGKNFDAKIAESELVVSFNETEVNEIIFASSVQISVKIPEGSTTGLIAVTINNIKTEGPVFTVLDVHAESPTITSIQPTSGSVGTSVTITGTNFSTTPTENVVNFSGTPATVTSSTSTTITTSVPAGATTGEVVVMIEDVVSEGILFTVRRNPPVNYKIAFIGDTGIGSNADAVLELIKRENTDAVVHAGDLDYIDRPDVFEANINASLGENFPYFYSAGNHDEYKWIQYQGIYFVATCPDDLEVTPREAAFYIRDELAKTEATWRISFWHKNQRLMQIGGKANEAGWGVYEESRKGGAIIATGHEHSYSRTYEMSRFIDQTISSRGDTINIRSDDVETTSTDEGISFAFVSGLGGKSIREPRGGLETKPWWASVYHARGYSWCAFWSV